LNSKKSRIILRTKNNGTFTGVVKPMETAGFEAGVGIVLDEQTGILLWCPEGEIEEVIPLPAQRDQEDDLRPRGGNRDG